MSKRSEGVSKETEPYSLSDAKKARLLARLALAWDGQWFLKAYDEGGWELATQLNTRVRHAFGRIEMVLLLRTLGKRRATSPEDAAKMLGTYYGEVLAEGFEGDFQVERETLHVSVKECAALTGSIRANLDRHDQACLGCPELFRIYLETLLPNHTAEVTVLEQMGYGAERCRYEVRVKENT
jgi:hypothetical protein